MSTQILVVQNKSTVMADADLAAGITDLQTYLNGPVGQEWYVNVECHFETASKTVTGADGLLTIQDQLGVQGALGYHTKQADATGKIMYLGYVGAKDDIAAGANPWVTIGHEAAEWAADPDVSQLYFVAAQGGFFTERGENMAKEIADANEADQYGMKIGSHTFSGFVHREWFTGDTRPDGKYDSSGQITQPWMLLPGGYIGVQPLGRVSQWTQVTARGDFADAPWECHQKNSDGSTTQIMPPPGSRRRRRQEAHLLRSAALGLQVSAAPNGSGDAPPTAMIGQVRNDADALIAQASGSISRLEANATNVTTWLATMLSNLNSGKLKVRVTPELTPPFGASIWLEKNP
jgi:hypothetical protein